MNLLSPKQIDRIYEESLKEGRDAHKAAASAIFEVLYEDVTPVQRNFSKQYTFGMMFSSRNGESAKNIIQRLN